MNLSNIFKIKLNISLLFLNNSKSYIKMKDSCQKIIGFIFLAVTTLLMIVMGINYVKYLSFENGSCRITNVTYPQSLEDSSNLISCDCGRRCTSDAGICIRITGFLLESPNFKNRHFVSSVSVNYPRQDCTFAETRCPNAEKISDRVDAIQIAKVRAREFITHQNTQANIPCFYKHGIHYLYLKNEDQSTLFFIVCGFWTLSILCLCCCFCRTRDTTERSEFV